MCKEEFAEPFIDPVDEAVSFATPHWCYVLMLVCDLSFHLNTSVFTTGCPRVFELHQESNVFEENQRKP